MPRPKGPPRDLAGLRAAIGTVRVAGTQAEVVERARRILLVFVDSAANQGQDFAGIAAALADGSGALQIGFIELQSQKPPDGLACAEGCAFCCILNGEDGGTISQAEAGRLHDALAHQSGQTDGRGWHPKACPALDPVSRKCRAYDVRPMICRSYVSTDVSACEAIAIGQNATGSGVMGAYVTYLAALALSRAALKGLKRVSTFSLAETAQSAISGSDLETTLKSARHRPKSLDAERKRTAQGISKAR